METQVRGRRPSVLFCTPIRPVFLQDSNVLREVTGCYLMVFLQKSKLHLALSIGNSQNAESHSLMHGVIEIFDRARYPGSFDHLNSLTIVNPSSNNVERHAAAAHDVEHHPANLSKYRPGKIKVRQSFSVPIPGGNLFRGA